MTTIIKIVNNDTNDKQTFGASLRAKLKEIYRVSQTKPGHETGLVLGLSFVRVSGNSGNSGCYGAIPQNETLV